MSSVSYRRMKEEEALAAAQKKNPQAVPEPAPAPVKKSEPSESGYLWPTWRNQ